MWMSLTNLSSRTHSIQSTNQSYLYSSSNFELANLNPPPLLIGGWLAIIGRTVANRGNRFGWNEERVQAIDRIMDNAYLR